MASNKCPYCGLPAPKPHDAQDCIAVIKAAEQNEYKYRIDQESERHFTFISELELSRFQSLQQRIEAALNARVAAVKKEQHAGLKQGA